MNELIEYPFFIQDRQSDDGMQPDIELFFNFFA